MEGACQICEKMNILQTAPGGAIVCSMCLEVVKVANLFRWRADEAGVPPVEVDEELLDILRRILGYEGSPTSN